METTAISQPDGFAEDVKPVAGLNQWSVIEYGMKTGLAGIVDGHLEIADGTFVYTSSVQSADYANRKVETRNTMYELETPAKSWVDSLTPEQREKYSV